MKFLSSHLEQSDKGSRNIDTARSGMGESSVKFRWPPQEKRTQTLSPTLSWHDDMAVGIRAFIGERNRDVTGSVTVM
jgi:hypothetical protein